MGIYDKPKDDDTWSAFCFLFEMFTGYGGGIIPTPGIQWFTKKEMARQRLRYRQRNLTPKS